ncbi:hypothetical protein HAX54_052625 [Datura stramonium]|uniref:Uncharacterized protein n=1 Tax=Datura stramonium TaxID=4076 RepID=A0ABS8WNP6_DATST|nr:hypothetical protein [Datura stramonium]
MGAGVLFLVAGEGTRLAGGGALLMQRAVQDENRGRITWVNSGMGIKSTHFMWRPGGPCQDLGGLGGKEDEEALTEQIINPDVEGNEESPEDLRFLLKAPKGV